MSAGTKMRDLGGYPGFVIYNLDEPNKIFKIPELPIPYFSKYENHHYRADTKYLSV